MIDYLWLIPVSPLLAAGISAFLSKSQARISMGLAIGSLSISLALSLAAFFQCLSFPDGVIRQAKSFASWMPVFEGDTRYMPRMDSIQLSFILDPLSASMSLMVCFIGLLIFIFSVGYMSHDENRGRFFCFLSFFAAAMLGLILANNLLILFMCWELVGLASYLLIGFWFQKPEAAAAAKKAFITTRIGDIGFLLGLLWLNSSTGTLNFYGDNRIYGFLDAGTLTRLTMLTTIGGLTVSTAISLLLFCGAVGKSGQFPLHVWLPDAMEGPTPVSALIHAATMVAAGVFLMARVYPLLDADPNSLPGMSQALSVIAWVGSLTALMAALIAVAQNDIKRILAYSTVSQLGYMFLGLATGGVGVAMLHLLTHAFFKALLFLGAGSVIHGCHHEQDIRRMGGLRHSMPITFKTYAVGMMALAGVPLLFSGFWSKDEILHSAAHWSVSKIPFLIGLAGAFLTAFYMTRQVAWVFFGENQLHTESKSPLGHQEGHREPIHESPRVMTMPLMILAFMSVALSLVATPVWPWLETFLEGHHAEFSLSKSFRLDVIGLLLLSSIVVFTGIGIATFLYGIVSEPSKSVLDPLETLWPRVYSWLERRMLFDELYATTVGKLCESAAKASVLFDRYVLDSFVGAVAWTTTGLAWVSKFADEFLINLGFDKVCARISRMGRAVSEVHSGRIQEYLAALAMAVVTLGIFLAWISQ